jgi:hypothetical protein
MVIGILRRVFFVWSSHSHRSATLSCSACGPATTFLYWRSDRSTRSCISSKRHPPSPSQLSVCVIRAQRALLLWQTMVQCRLSSTVARTKSGAMFVFRSVQNRKFCPQPPGIGFRAVRKTNALHSPGSPLLFARQHRAAGAAPRAFARGCLMMAATIQQQAAILCSKNRHSIGLRARSRAARKWARAASTLPPRSSNSPNVAK